MIGLFILLVLLMLCVVGVLVYGLITMARGGTINQHRSNIMMRWRVALQGLALLVFMAFLLVSGAG